ncbi:MAG TPA: Flp family type IVb pilin [Alphaproteobacteria bacterium]|nr:Flp family type IVb pilin [Alphaproteobacteria bacterium]HAJ47954.1 Flp family type IVb pilin [Alphaproteobacteria bacterium]
MPLQIVRRFVADESGATAIEYSMVLLLVVIGIIAIVDQIGGSLLGMFNAALAGFT